MGRWGPPDPLHHPRLFQTQKPLLPDDQVIQHFDAHDLACLDHAFRQIQILPARGDVAGRMIVRQDHAGSGGSHGREEHLARMHQRGVEAPDRNVFPADDLVAAGRIARTVTGKCPDTLSGRCSCGPRRFPGHVPCSSYMYNLSNLSMNQMLQVFHLHIKNHQLLNHLYYAYIQLFWFLC